MRYDWTVTPSPETVATAGATGAAAGLAGLVGVTEPMTYVVITLMGMLFRAFQALQAANAALIAEHGAHRDSVRAERHASIETLRGIRERNRPLMRDHLDWRTRNGGLRSPPSALEMELSGVQASADAEGERLTELDKG